MLLSDPCFNFTFLEDRAAYIHCRITNDACRTLFSSPSLGFVKIENNAAIKFPTCPISNLPIPDTTTLKHFFNQKFYNREFSEWKPGEWESVERIATSIVNQIAREVGFKDHVKLILQDPESCAKSGAFESAETSVRTKEIQACKPFYHNLIGLNGWHEQDNAKGTIAHEIGHLDDSLRHMPFSRWEEMLADLYTLRNPQRSRGLRNGLVKVAKMIPLEVEIAQHREQDEWDVHPYNFERIRYLTEGLCALYPEKNQDIC